MTGQTNLYESKKLPLLYRASKENVYGRRWKFPQSAITDALFVYFEGAPEPESMERLKEFEHRPLVCLSVEWKDYIVRNFPSVKVFERFCMKEKSTFEFDKEGGADKADLPPEFTVVPFSKVIFENHPFEHGKNYSSFQDFTKTGAGAVVLCEGKIVSSASSFLSYNGEVELDVSTKPEFRKMGLATACVRLMLEQCQKKGLTVHWDAQNKESKLLAQKFGFKEEYTYSVYVIGHL